MISFDGSSGWRFFQEISDPIMGPQERLHLLTQILVSAARIVQERGTLLKRDFNSLTEDIYLAACIVIHGILKPFSGQLGDKKPLTACFQSPPAALLA
ncbi:MAG: hypothetical protein WDM80_18535 [Limisphaerales bacterium]